MDKYEVVDSLGEGSFGRVYKAKQLSSGQIVALKVISKRSRSNNEIKDLRGECDIQRHLHHPNIIQMLDSFETDNEIVVITEFAHKALNIILKEHNYLAENRVQTIVWDLVSALYYLHSHRVLHRDLKPQNILLDTKSRAKLCDFGFARNMSTGTHVLTSIKGTPLYMAPELIDALPYDHNADLWSLGCIIYELLVGAPPFCTTSILHLITRIKSEQVQWPTFLSTNCISFLKGLLQKDPKKRLTWNDILNHPWVKGNILILDDDLTMPLTNISSSKSSSLKALEKKDCAASTTGSKEKIDIDQKKCGKKIRNTLCEHNKATAKLGSNCDDSELMDKINNLCVHDDSEVNKHGEIDENEKYSQDNSKSEEHIDKCNKDSINSLKFCEETHLIETEEWSVFLLKSIEEVMSGEMISLTQPNLTNILISPLKNSTTSPQVLTYVAKLFSISFVVKGISKETLESAKKVYLEVKLVPNLIHSSALLLRRKTDSFADNIDKYKNLSDWSDDDLEALQYIYLLISHLVHIQHEFLLQFSEALAALNIFHVLRRFFSLSKRKPRIVLELVAILTQVLRKIPENSEVVEKVLMNDVGNEENPLNFINLLRHEHALMRERICYLILFLGKICPHILEDLWDENVKETLEALMFDSMENVRNAAEVCSNELKCKEFYGSS